MWSPFEARFSTRLFTALRICCKLSVQMDSHFRRELRLARIGKEIWRWNSLRLMRCWFANLRKEVNQEDVFPRLSSRHHVAAGRLGDSVSTGPVCAASVL